MQDSHLIDEQRYAVESLLELQNANDHVEHSFDWNATHQPPHNPKLSATSYNFLQLNKKLTPQNLDQNNFINRQRLLNLQRFRRPRSLFDPMKIFKMGTRQLVYDDPETQHQRTNSKGDKIIHKHPDEVRDLNFKSGHPTRTTLKKDDLNLTTFSEMRHKSNEFINGESVIIQVQSYEENFNRKEVEYLMSKTLGARNFRSQMNFQKKDDVLGISLLEIKSQDMKLKKDVNSELKQVNKNGANGRMTSRMRFTAYANKKSAQKQPGTRGQQASSLDLKRTKANNEIAISLRLLLNNLKSKTYSQGKKSQSYGLELVQYQYHNGVSKIFDKERIFKNYEEEMLKNEKNKLSSRGKFQKELFKGGAPEKLTKHESQKMSSKQYEQNGMIRVSSPRRYYQQKGGKKNSEDRDVRIFNIKKIA